MESAIIHCRKCKVVNPENVTACRNCGSDLLAQFTKPDPRRNILLGGAGLSALLFGAVALLNRLLAGEWLWECAIVTVITVVLGCGIAAIAMKCSRDYQSDPFFQRALYHKELDPQQAVADFRQVLETRPETQTSPAARIVIYRELADLYVGLDLEEELDAAVRVVIDSYNEEIEKPRYASEIGMSMKAREDFCQKHTVPSRLSNRQPTGTCAACSRHLEGQRYHFFMANISSLRFPRCSFPVWRSAAHVRRPGRSEAGRMCTCATSASLSRMGSAGPGRRSRRRRSSFKCRGTIPSSHRRSISPYQLKTGEPDKDGLNNFNPFAICLLHLCGMGIE